MIPAGKITLRPVEEADQDFLLSVYASSRADEMARVPWSPEQKQAFVRTQFTASHSTTRPSTPAPATKSSAATQCPWAGSTWTGAPASCIFWM